MFSSVLSSVDSLTISSNIVRIGFCGKNAYLEIHIPIAYRLMTFSKIINGYIAENADYKRQRIHSTTPELLNVLQNSSSVEKTSKTTKTERFVVERKHFSVSCF